MAITSSGVYVQNMLDILDATQSTYDYITDDMKLALYTDALVPNFQTDVAYNNTAEVGNSGTYVAKGTSIAGQAITIDTGSLLWDATDHAYTSATISAMGCIFVNETSTSPAVDGIFCLLDFVTLVVSTSGTFTIQFASGPNAFFAWDMTP